MTLILSAQARVTRRQLTKAALIGALSGTLPLAPSIWARATETIRLTSRGDNNSSYAIGAIKLALNKVGTPFTLAIQETDFAPLRQRKELRDGGMDVLWTATATELEEEVIPVRIPLYKGLLGHRILIVHKDNKRLFSGVDTWDGMLARTYGQGRSWTDTTIMKANGMTVVPAVKYENLFFMADGKRFDAFPRGVHEPWSEVEKLPQLDLTVDENVMLVYRMPFYLFVTPTKKHLAEDLHNGFMLAIEDGSFDEYFFTNPTVKMVIEKARLKDRKVFQLKNPDLPTLTPVDDPRLWVDISKL
jgi:hypothetical protein